MTVPPVAGSHGASRDTRLPGQSQRSHEVASSPFAALLKAVVTRTDRGVKHPTALAVLAALAAVPPPAALHQVSDPPPAEAGRPTSAIRAANGSLKLAVLGGGTRTVAHAHPAVRPSAAATEVRPLAKVQPPARLPSPAHEVVAGAETARSPAEPHPPVADVGPPVASTPHPAVRRAPVVGVRGRFVEATSSVRQAQGVSAPRPTEQGGPLPSTPVVLSRTAAQPIVRPTVESRRPILPVHQDQVPVATVTPQAVAAGSVRFDQSGGSPVAPQMAAIIAQHLPSLPAGGRLMLRIAVHPPMLGPVSVTIVRSAQGISLVMVAATQEAGAALTSGADELKRRLGSIEGDTPIELAVTVHDETSTSGPDPKEG